jgi:lipopolysaccharide export system permease protein
MAYAAASFVPMALPLAVLLAALMTFGGLGENYELTALKSAGISLKRIMYPLFILIAFISIAAFFYSNISLPYFNWKMRSLIYDIQQQRPELQLKEGTFFNGIENYSIRIGKKDPKTNLIHNIKIYDHTSNRGNVSVTTADSGYIRMTADKRALILILFHGESYVEIKPERSHRGQPKTYPLRRDKFEKQEINIELEGFDFTRSDEELFKNNYQMMNLGQLGDATDSIYRELKKDKEDLAENLQYAAFLSNPFRGNPNDTTPVKDTMPINKVDLKKLLSKQSDQDKIMTLNFALSQARNAKSLISTEAQIRKSKTKKLRKHEIEWHKKFTLSLACIVFFLIGAPLGAIIRKGGLGMPLVISVLFFVLYYVITLMGEKFVKESMVSAVQGVWISSAILLPLGLFLTYKANADAALFNIEIYMLYINKFYNLKIFNIFKKKELN